MSGASSLPWSPIKALATLDQIGDRPIVLEVSGGQVNAVSGAELRRRTLGTVSALREAGIGCGSVVAIWAPNSAAWIAAGLACHLLGAVLAPIDALLSADEAREQIVASGAALVFVAQQSADALGDEIACLDLAKLPTHGDDSSIEDLTGDDPIAQFRTSGTTGAPKVFHLSLRNIGWNVHTISGIGLVTAEDRVLMPLPLHHVFPWITATLTCLTVGATLILPESPTGPQIAEALRLGRGTIIVGVPRLFEAMLAGIRGRIGSKGRLAILAYNSGLGLAKGLRHVNGGWLGSTLLAPVRRAIAPDLRLLVSGGARLPIGVEGELAALGWDVRTGYGLAETAASVTAPSLAKRPGSVGQPVAGCKIRIDDPGKDGTGEILLHGPMVFSGYIDNPKANAEAFTEDGYFRTGDLGWLDADGFLYVTGRKKEVIVLAGGDNLYPEDVEKRYLTDPEIEEIGVMERDGALVALIVPNLVAVAKTGASNPEDAVRVALGTVARSLPSTWRLAGFALTRQSLPRTRLGKLRRFRLPELYDRAKSGNAEMAARALTGEEQEWIEMPPRAAVWAILRRDHGTPPFDLDSHLQLDLGLDSFAWMSLSVAIEQATSVRLDQADIATIATVRDLLVRVSDKATVTGGDRPDMAEALVKERNRWLAPRTALEQASGWIVQSANNAVMRLAFRLRVEGADTLPDTGPVLICPNHVSDMDAFVLAAALPSGLRRRVVWAATRQRLFNTPLRRAFSRISRIFPVDETAPNIAVELAIESLAKGAAQVWFPEGWRSPDGRLLPFHAGIGRVVLRSHAPVVATYIAGTLEAWPRDRQLPHPAPVTVIFAPPVSAEELIAAVPEGGDAAQAIADALRARVAHIAPTTAQPGEVRNGNVGVD
ncbi:MAG: AMP-binding protein [Hyphomicrobiales bacterium]|nr:AMP-binding protein [Hyphomicrobiales bacterium]